MRILWMAGFAAVSSLSLGQDDLATFRPVAGEREFSGRMIVRPVQPGVNEPRQKGAISNTARRNRAVRTLYGMALHHAKDTDEFLIRIPRGWNENSLSKALMQTGDFQYAEPDWILHPAAVPNDPIFDQQWHLDRVNAPGAWDMFTGNANVTIAVCDTGVRLDHEDLAPRLVPGYNSISNLPQMFGGDVWDVNGHGTMAAGIAAAAGNNGRGVSGVGWQFKLMPIRVTNNTNGAATMYNIVTGVRWAADNGARVISVSFSGVASAAVGATGDYVRGKNALLFWAAGNENANLYGFDHANVTVVGATDAADNKEPYSSYGRGVDVFAPGAGLWSTSKASTNSYATFSGTSASTPCAAGIAALIMGANPKIPAAAVEQLLFLGCNHKALVPDDPYWGWGIVNAEGALQGAYSTYGFLPNGIKTYFTTAMGNVASIQQSDDLFLTLTGKFDPARDDAEPMVMAATETTIASLGNLTLEIEAHANSNDVLMTVMLFDYSANSWSVVDVKPLDLSDKVFTVSPSGAWRFRSSNGQMKALVTFMGSKMRQSYSASIDQITWYTMP